MWKMIGFFELVASDSTDDKALEDMLRINGCLMLPSPRSNLYRA